MSAKTRKSKTQNTKNHPLSAKIYGDYEQVFLADKKVEREYLVNSLIVDEQRNGEKWQSAKMFM